MIKFEDFLRVVDLEEQKLNVIVDNNLGSLTINNFLHFKDYVVGFVSANFNEITLRLYEGVKNDLFRSERDKI